MLAMELKLMVVITLSCVVLVRECQTAGNISKNAAECKVGGVKYKDGQSFYISQNPVQYNDITCQSCICDKGVKICNDVIICDYFFPCEKFIPAPQGKCCPTCSCQHQGIKYRHGDTWINRQKKACFKCSCLEGQSRCTMEHCEAYCSHPIYEPDKCCPTCFPSVPTTDQPYIVIPNTTPRPPPVLPPFPGFPGKRGLIQRNKDKPKKQ